MGKVIARIFLFRYMLLITSIMFKNDNCSNYKTSLAFKIIGGEIRIMLVSNTCLGGNYTTGARYDYSEKYNKDFRSPFLLST